MVTEYDRRWVIKPGTNLAVIYMVVPYLYLNTKRIRFCFTLGIHTTQFKLLTGLSAFFLILYVIFHLLSSIIDIVNMSTEVVLLLRTYNENESYYTFDA